MTKSSSNRRAAARARKRRAQYVARTGDRSRPDAPLPEMSLTDKRYMLAFAVLSAIITAFYWSLGGRNLLVFPAVFCISVGARKYWSGPIRRFAKDD